MIAVIRRKVVAALAATAALGTLGVAATPAGATEQSIATRAAAAGCFDGGCTGKDPQALGCAADAVTVEQIFVWDNVWDLRYSRACNAHWGRLSKLGGGSGSTTNLDGAPPDRPGYTFTAWATNYTPPGMGKTWTAMGAGRDSVRVCAHVDYVRPTPWYCTKWY
ncbi:DUF2690 domain-containing protein [Streptomyces sp. NPDC006971]|uniref:DUF2690 domain-containing protein n=1 Tax=Streptomyces sp. NPDC006971 TaxID=3154784 RepID=UPI0033CB1F7B